MTNFLSYLLKRFFEAMGLLGFLICLAIVMSFLSGI